MPVVNRIYIPQTGQLGPATLQTEGAWVELEVAIPTGLEAYLRQQSLPIPKPTAGRALIDTGATFSAIDDSIMRALGVKPINVVQGGTANGPALQYIYPARFIFTGLGWTFEFTRATGVNLTGTGYIALVGRDVLALMSLVYNGPLGIVTLAI